MSLRLPRIFSLEEPKGFRVVPVFWSFNWALPSNHILLLQRFYEQTSGAAMGSPISPVIAKIFMELFEKEALQTSKKPEVWFRYIDDTFVIWRLGRAEFHNT